MNYIFVVNWATPIPDFPYVSGLTPIVISWVSSPILSGFLSSFVYSFVKIFILRSENAGNLSTLFFPVILGITFFIESFLIITKGATSQLGWTIDQAAWVSAVVGAVGGVLSCVCIPYLRKGLRTYEEKAALGLALKPYDLENEIFLNFEQKNCFAYAYQEFFRDPYTIKPHGWKPEDDEIKANKNEESTRGPIASKEKLAEEMGSPELADAEAVVKKESGEEIVDLSLFEQYDPGAEYVFRYLQVFTACCASFAHGSNDVSNAAGPFAGIYGVWSTGSATNKASCPLWIISISAGGICIGLATYGRKIMELLGSDLTFISPARGFCAEISAAWVITLCSAYGFPISTTQCITGAIIGISLCDLPFYKLKWGLIGSIFLSWILTIIITGLISAALFAQGVHSPNVNYLRQYDP